MSQDTAALSLLSLSIAASNAQPIPLSDPSPGNASRNQQVQSHHRRLSSTGRRRRLSDARDAATRPTSAGLSMAALSLSSSSASPPPPVSMPASAPAKSSTPIPIAHTAAGRKKRGVDHKCESCSKARYFIFWPYPTSSSTRLFYRSTSFPIRHTSLPSSYSKTPHPLQTARSSPPYYFLPLPSLPYPFIRLSPTLPPSPLLLSHRLPPSFFAATFTHPTPLAPLFEAWYSSPVSRPALLPLHPFPFSPPRRALSIAPSFPSSRLYFIPVARSPFLPSYFIPSLFVAPSFLPSVLFPSPSHLPSLPPSHPPFGIFRPLCRTSPDPRPSYLLSPASLFVSLVMPSLLPLPSPISLPRSFFVIDSSCMFLPSSLHLFVVALLFLVSYTFSSRPCGESSGIILYLFLVALCPFPLPFLSPVRAARAIVGPLFSFRFPLLPIYRHPSCLIKHRWEHTPHWRTLSSLPHPSSSGGVLSKHAQVQLLEAAAILSHLSPNSETGTSLPEDRGMWPRWVSGGALEGEPGSAGTGAGSYAGRTGSEYGGRSVGGGVGPRLHDYEVPHGAEVRAGVVEVPHRHARGHHGSGSGQSAWSVPRSVSVSASVSSEQSRSRSTPSDDEEDEGVGARVWKREEEEEFGFEFDLGGVREEEGEDDDEGGLGMGKRGGGVRGRGESLRWGGMEEMDDIDMDMD
ncbi:hypothetical protein DFH09DRAFT_1318359 [Mycena vulgaris]|nr:hypothetical protein DFH09DRAFT_1318359 [Mycena vulgaris]